MYQLYTKPLVTWTKSNKVTMFVPIRRAPALIEPAVDAVTQLAVSSDQCFELP